MAEKYNERMRRINQEAIDKFVDRTSAVRYGNVSVEEAFHSTHVFIREHNKLFTQLFAAVDALADKVQELEDRLDEH